MKPGGTQLDDLVRSANPIDLENLPDPSRCATAQALYQRIVTGQLLADGERQVYRGLLR